MYLTTELKVSNVVFYKVKTTFIQLIASSKQNNIKVKFWKYSTNIGKW